MSFGLVVFAVFALVTLSPLVWPFGVAPFGNSHLASRRFARYIVRSYDRPGGPKLVASLTATGNVFQTADAKAYEMMSNLVGLVDFPTLIEQTKNWLI